MSPVIRPAQPDDARALLAYMKAIFSEPDLSLPVEPDEFSVSLADENEVLAKAAANPRELFLVAVDGAKVVGVLNVVANQRRANQHDVSFGLTVARDYRGQGLGTRLLEQMLAWARSNDLITSVNLTVWKRNRAAIRLYRRFGFRPCGERKYAVHRYGRFQTVVAMELLLQ
ncbi:MAG: GNAT family protein [Spirochaetales bacterium]